MNQIKQKLYAKHCRDLFKMSLFGNKICIMRLRKRQVKISQKKYIFTNIFICI